MTVNNEIYGRITQKSFDEIIASHRGDTK